MHKIRIQATIHKRLHKRVGHLSISETIIKADILLDIHIRIQQRNGRKTLTTVEGIPSKFDLKKVLKVIKKYASLRSGIQPSVTNTNSSVDNSLVTELSFKTRSRVM